MLISAGDADFRFEWNLQEDHARLILITGERPIWSGPLLPLLWVSVAGAPPRAIKAALDRSRSSAGLHSAEVGLTLGELGRANLGLAFDAESLRLKRFELEWNGPPVDLISLHWGSDLLTPGQRQAAPSLSCPFWPAWRAEGFGVAGAKTNPMQSFFRSWDFGQADIPLGSFGPAMGAPYGAAFPRPTFAAAMGGRHGWLCLGSGAIPDAALTLQVRSRSGAFEWLFREDLWGAPNSPTRSWSDPLWLVWGKSAWEAYSGYFRLFPRLEATSAVHQKSFWGTWGNFRLNRYGLVAAIDRGVDEMEADLICIDDPWEHKKGSCRPHPDRFAQFAADLAYARQRRLGIGIWMPIGWIEDPLAEGLTEDDLLTSVDGVPVKANWAIDPREEGPSFFCLDPSSSRVRTFLRDRTLRVMREYRPTLLKLDFSYGIPGPDACAPRDPALRGEMLAWTYARIVAEAARECDPTVTVLSYSINPLWDNVQDQCALDDLGDAGMHESEGHGQWSVWASLLGARGRALMASSGYHWSSETDNLLNTAILGAPGANLPSQLPDGTPLPASCLARRRALFRWHRRSTLWEPLWLDSVQGDLEHEPAPRNWGRLEPDRRGPLLTALALRRPTPEVMASPDLRGLTWNGSWAVIAQGGGSIFSAETVAAIPFGAGAIALPRDRPPAAVHAVWGSGVPTEVPWTWEKNHVQFSVDAAAAYSDLLGFVVT